MVVAGLLEHEVHVRRPPRMPAQGLQQRPDRPVVRDRICHGHDGLEPEDALGVAGHDAAAVGPGVVGVLHVVVARGVGLPDVDLAAGDGVAGRVFEGAEHEARLAGGVGGDGGAIGQVLGFVRVEGPQDGAFGAVGGFRVVDRVDQEREAQHVRQQDELLETRSAAGGGGGGGGGRGGDLREYGRDWIFGAILVGHQCTSSRWRSRTRDRPSIPSYSVESPAQSHEDETPVFPGYT